MSNPATAANAEEGEEEEEGEGEDIHPPSYQEANSEPRAIPLIIQLHQHSPGQLLDKNLMYAGKLVTSQGDAILLPTTITYEQALKFLRERVLARAGLMMTTGKSKKDYRFFCRLVMVVDGQQKILLEEGSWIAARHFLRYRDGAELEVLFCVVDAKKYCGGGLLETLRRKVEGVEVGRGCLVEVGF
ncbi:hypothetical protein BST61_g1012 [Cercospora zeina]